MALYSHRFSGSTPAGEQFLFSWWSSSSSALSAIHAAGVQWVTDLWAGATSGNGYADHLASSCVCNQVSTGLIDMATGQQLEVAQDTVSLPGTSAVGPTPAATAIAVSLRTTRANRSGRGRFFLPGATRTEINTDGRIIPSAITDYVDSLQNAWSTYNTSATPVVYSRLHRDTANINTFDVGDLFDNISGRRSKLVETRTSSPMP